MRNSIEGLRQTAMQRIAIREAATGAEMSLGAAR